jgi:predicted acetyltransferase
VPELIAPTVALHRPWLELRDDFGPGVHLDGAGLHPEDDVDTVDGFAAWVRRLGAESDPAVPVAAGRVHCTYRWITDGDVVLGSIALRHELNDFLLEAGGHIGYSVRPAARRRGLAAYALGEVLKGAKALGLPRVLITCEVTNEASRRTIVGAGGVQEDVRETVLGTVRRFWVPCEKERPGRADGDDHTHR